MGYLFKDFVAGYLTDKSFDLIYHCLKQNKKTNKKQKESCKLFVIYRTPSSPYL